MELCRRYILIELEMELFPSVRITDEKILSVIPLLFAGFLVVTNYRKKSNTTPKDEMKGFE